MVKLERAAAGVSARALQAFLRRAQRAAGVRGEVAVVITGNRRMRALNREFRRKDDATDVLSFPVAVPGRDGDESAGDIAISAEIAGNNARRYGHSLAEELKILVLHGLLHLAGYDHERDNGTMLRREQRLRRELGLASALTERADPAAAAKPRPARSRR